MPIAIRRLVPADFSAVVRIDAAHTGQRTPAHWRRVFREFVTGHDSKRRVALGVTDGRALVGFVFGDIRAFEFGSEPCGWILEIGVDPHAVRQGIASRLLGDACRQLRRLGVSTIRTMVRRNNVPVLTFFRTNGFGGGPYVQLELTPEMDVSHE